MVKHFSIFFRRGFSNEDAAEDFGVRNSRAGLFGWADGSVNNAPLVAAQQAVTATAAALPTNSVHGFCVKALPTNSITVYVGPSGVTDSTGYPLNGGDSICYQSSNTNLAYVIASTTGASVAFTGN